MCGEKRKRNIILTVVLCAILFFYINSNSRYVVNKETMMEQKADSSKLQIKDLQQVSEAIKEYIARDKFVETSDYPGLGDEEMREPLNNRLNVLAEQFLQIAGKPTVKLYRDAIKQLLDDMDDVYLDTEDEDHFLLQIEELMDIVGLESSQGLLNQWRYGFEV